MKKYKNLISKILLITLVVSCFIGFIVELKVCNGVFNAWSTLTLSLAIIGLLLLVLLFMYTKATKFDDKVDSCKSCPKCNTANDLDARYCKYCGSKFDDTKDEV